MDLLRRAEVLGEVRNGVEHVNWSQSPLNWAHTNVQSITAQCASIEFQLFLHRWIPLNSYYNLRHESFSAYVMTNYWAGGAAIALAEFEVLRLSRRAPYR